MNLHRFLRFMETNVKMDTKLAKQSKIYIVFTDLWKKIQSWQTHFLH